MVILVSAGGLAQSAGDDERPGAASQRAEKKTQGSSEAERARRQADRAIGEAANPDRSAGAVSEDRDPGDQRESREADREDHGNETSREMLQRRDETKAIKDEYKAAGEKQSGKKPWKTAGKDPDAGDDPEDQAGEGKSRSRASGAPGRSDDRDHD
jgi:hypothetical protein